MAAPGGAAFNVRFASGPTAPPQLGLGIGLGAARLAPSESDSGSDSAVGFG
eukprot:CAMPEP_0177713018 /NCGR_PEP_ID=MMETSP0484_2-20121128/12710_1 /TAXON_ID=354590 /ORGANISM="Rhodomonas lens, Strain RHODO" /LENGTH=50 /DNA_ID=CAMNT_0019224869 /DNA_START=80 /DNA_END=229 /DNA_ORIENTATION=-